MRVRIASLVPSATEALFALGLGDSVVAVTHECDHPEATRSLPKLTSSVIADGLPPAEIDARVREVTGRGESLYRLDEAALAALEPDLIVTQALCAVCAVSYDDVRAVASRLPSHPRVISQDPETLEEVLADLTRLAWATGNPRLGERLLKGLRVRLAAVAEAVAGTERPRVAALEWLDPVYIGGHWVPEMIVAAGGEDALGVAGAKSRVVDWEVVAEARPDVVVVMPCGLYAPEAAAQARDHGDRLRSLGAERVVAVDAASSFSRPGPRLVDGVELLAHLFHPDLVEAPAEIACEPVTAPAAS
ncbi:MAG: iron complex transport system substrate-binding protein [Solirubrobacterales bacterium]|nr:iron complex transport system substrate-binding protein [Solirubrobacterales bacterium]